MSAIKPLTVWVHGQGPNPFKVLITLEELGIPYKAITIENPKDESFLKINPNGRLPAIQDPNANDLILWESGAIVEYIVETYDKENKLTFTEGPEKWYLKQYLHFQMSGQGPYFGQHVWFHKFHPEDVPSAKKRYDEQTLRVFEVLNTILEGKEYLVGDKFTYADLVFIPWDRVVDAVSKDMVEKAGGEKKFPNFFAWNNRLMARPSVKKLYGL
ncbi:glutathione S-transferase [Pochonia chlamydosporia 170]|uniref:Glutathione S-transferase n=1 Tax=Pochonia chlamydosporia 170 TaxID=1380566 RepID=A0A179FTQ0_METCM|nr:glutathione S-transferase [Pochonia chlamydosporia 170]OAQ68982.1 glutathione S-transferase [Pochonia chlamydosporia 170]